MPRYSGKETEVKNQVLAELNQRNCFDFNFTPQKDDFLKLRVSMGIDGPASPKWFHFRFQMGKWYEDKTSSLARWKTQLEPYKDGIIDSSPS